MTDKETFEVGYGKPPRHTRFKKGQSGNQKGRPRGSRNFKTEIEEVLTEPVTINWQGKPKKVTSRMAGLLRLREKAISKGDQRALEKFFEFAGQHLDEQQTTETRRLKSQDQEILRRFFESQNAAVAPDMDLTEESSSDDS